MRDGEQEEKDGKRARRIGEWLEAVEQGRGAKGLEGALVVDVRLRMPTEEDPMTLLIVKASGPAGRFIAFIGALTATQALLAWRAREAGKGMKWRVNVPWDER